MLSSSTTWAPLGLLVLAARGICGNVHRPYSVNVNGSTIYDTITCTSNVTFIDTTTIISSTTVPVTHYVDVTVSYYVNETVSSTKTHVETTCITESTTTTIQYTVSITETDLATVTNTETDLATVTNTETDLATVTTTKTDSATVTNTETDLATVTNTETDSATVTNTETTTATVPATITTYTTQTLIETTYDPCPTTCSISAGTVNLYFWPTDRPYSYPSTYVDTALAYTFTWPSVYMLIPTAKGTNSLGPAGPSTSNWILPLDLAEVSTIVDGSITRQLTLSHLGTDCAKTAEPSAIATMVDSRCDPILAAPRQVSSWAAPCNACGRFGLFDPPYAVPTLTGGLVETTAPTPAPVQTTAAPAPTPAPVGTLLIVYYVDGKPVSTATVPTTGVSGTVTSSVALSLTGTANPTSAVASTTAPVLTTSPSLPPVSPTVLPSSESAPGLSTSPSLPPVSPTALPSTSPATGLTTSSPLPTLISTAPPSTSPTTSVVVGSAMRVTGGLAWFIPSALITMLLL